MPAARELAPWPAVAASTTTTRPAPSSRAKTEAQPPTVPAPTTTRSALSLIAPPSSRASASTAMAALRPLRAMTLPPGCVAAPQKYRPGTGVRGVRRCSHIWSGVTSPWKMLPPVSPMRCSMSGGPSTS